MYLNRQHGKRREELGKSAEIVDESMLSGKDAENGKAIELEEAPTDQRKGVEQDNGLRDVTDLKNEDFIYVY